jgi:hypothetical protein
MLIGEVRAMNDREKLVELLNKAIRYAINNCKNKDPRAILDTPDVADYLLANGVTVQEWIPVTERLPKNDYDKHWKERQYYLVCLQNGTMRVAHYGYKEYGWWVDSHHCVLEAKRYTGVTHWMPPPEPPKKEVKEHVLRGESE